MWTLNASGAMDQPTRKAGAGSILGNGHTDVTGSRGSIKPLGTDSSILAELWGLMDGLRMARNLRIDYLLVKLDVLIVINI